jgi:hypothetical protein
VSWLHGRETDQVLIALGELADAAKDLQRNAEDRKREPAKTNIQCSGATNSSSMNPKV